MKRVTIRDVAREVDVSISTVSRVLNGNPCVDEELRLRVNSAVERLGYIPNANARYVRTGSSRIIGVILPEARNKFFAQILDGALECALEHGYHIVVFSSGGSEGRDAGCLYSAASSAAIGLIYCPVSTVDTEQLKSLISRQIPVVIAARHGIMPGLPHVYTDNVDGCYRATRYLLHQGHRRIAFFAGFWEQPARDVDGLMALMDSDRRGTYSSLERLEGYRIALQEAGVEFDKSLVAMTGYSYDSGYATMNEFLPAMVSFDAVICANDWVAAGVLQALQEQNISVPDQVSIVGYDDDTDVARIARPMLTSVRQFPYSIGRYSVELILDMLAGGSPQDRVIETALTVRNSTAVKRKPAGAR